jgi:hypothetical protein
MEEEVTQWSIIENILQEFMVAVSPGWQEIVIDYFVEDDRSGIMASYLIEENGEMKEKDLRIPSNFDFTMRELQEHLGQGGKPLFTRCTIQVLADGKYEAKYDYRKIDWDALLEPDWIFFPKMNKDYMVSEE